MKIFSIPLAVLIASLLSACVTVPDVNQSFRRIDRVWALEYQKMESSVRVRVIDDDFITVMRAVRGTFLELGMPINELNLESGDISAICDAPTPLTDTEWLAVVETEKVRVREIGGWYMSLSEKPVGYVLTVKAKVKRLREGSLVVLDYSLSHPEYSSMGFEPAKHAPPEAVRIGSFKFWTLLEQRMGRKKLRLQSPADIEA
jgi:hypothetical protein